MLQGITTSIFAGHRVGLVGHNGCGKTTLMRVILGDLEEDEGEVIRQKNLQISYFSQTPTLNEANTVFHEAFQGNKQLLRIETDLELIEQKMSTASPKETEALVHDQAKLWEEFERLDGYRYRSRTEEVLEKLGFTRDMFNLSPACLSGGQKNLLALARILLTPSDLLLLDEPTNFLDIERTEWLEQYLSELPIAMVIISHDRYLLNKVVGEIWEIRRGKLCCYTGDYDAYTMAREEELQGQEERYERQQAEIRRQEDYIQRYTYGARHAQAQSRKKMVEKMVKIQAPVHDSQNMPHFNIQAANNRMDKILEIADLGHAFGDKDLFHNLNLSVRRGDKLAILGPNGCGKSTLLHLIIGRLQPVEGLVDLGSQVRVGFYHQQLEGLVDSDSVFDTIKKMAPTTDDQVIRTFLGRFLFRKDNIYKDVRGLSGGEKGRLALAKLLWEKPNFLILDEPTNHLDIFARQALEESLQGYEGTLLFVSHDRYFIDKVATRLLYFFQKSWLNFFGNYTEFQASKEQVIENYQANELRNKEKENRAKALKNKEAKAKASGADKSAPKKDKGKPGNKKNKVRKRYSIEELEANIVTAEDRLKQITLELAKSEVYQNVEKVRHLKEEYDIVERRLKDWNQEWEEWGEQA